MLLVVLFGWRLKKIFIFNLSNRIEVFFKSVIKFGIGDRFKVIGINFFSRGGKVIFIYIRVIS